MGAYLVTTLFKKCAHENFFMTRHDHNTMPPAAKTVGNYVNSSLAKVEALKAGYDEAIMLSPSGLVAECTGENIFCVRNGVI